MPLNPVTSVSDKLCRTLLITIGFSFLVFSAVFAWLLPIAKPQKSIMNAKRVTTSFSAWGRNVRRAKARPPNNRTFSVRKIAKSFYSLGTGMSSFRPRPRSGSRRLSPALTDDGNSEFPSRRSRQLASGAELFSTTFGKKPQLRCWIERMSVACGGCDSGRRPRQPLQHGV